jgi:hypothetical protein
MTKRKRHTKMSHKATFDCDTCYQNLMDNNCSKFERLFPYAKNCNWYTEDLDKIRLRGKKVIPILNQAIPEKEVEEPKPIECKIYNTDTVPKVIFYSKLP